MIKLLFFGGISNGECHRVKIGSKTFMVAYMDYDGNGIMTEYFDHYTFKEIGFFFSHTTKYK